MNGNLEDQKSINFTEKNGNNNPKENVLNDFPIHLDIEATSACNFVYNVSKNRDDRK